MKKHLIILAFIVSGCSLVQAEDAISECIKKYDVKKLQEIASQNLVVRAEDRQKYLDQLATQKERINAYKLDIKKNGIFSREVAPPDCSPVVSPMVRKALILLGISAVSIALVFSDPTEPDARAAGLISISLVGSFTLLYLGCKKYYRATIYQIPDKLYRKVITMEGLVRTIPVAKDIVVE